VLLLATQMWIRPSPSHQPTSGETMSANVTTLIAAIVAVVGTLTSPVLTQRYANRARSQEIEAAKQQRLEDREEERRRTSLLDRRQNYAALHTAAWEFRLALKNCTYDDNDSDELERARQAFVTSYRNSQMICTDPVLRAAAPVYDELTDAYGSVKQLLPTASGPAEPSSARAGERSAVQDALNTQVEDAIREMRDAMRLDLGVSAVTDEANDQ
jgi:hypothetical protein